MGGRFNAFKVIPLFNPYAFALACLHVWLINDKSMIS